MRSQHVQAAWAVRESYPLPRADRSVCSLVPFALVIVLALVRLTPACHLSQLLAHTGCSLSCSMQTALVELVVARVAVPGLVDAGEAEVIWHRLHLHQAAPGSAATTPLTNQTPSHLRARLASLLPPPLLLLARLQRPRYCLPSCPRLAGPRSGWAQLSAIALLMEQRVPARTASAGAGSSCCCSQWATETAWPIFAPALTWSYKQSLAVPQAMTAQSSVRHRSHKCTHACCWAEHACLAGQDKHCFRYTYRARTGCATWHCNRLLA